jgi:predicted MFS family arabinose efflux permease
MLVAALGIASIFAVYTFIGPFVTDEALLERRWVPVALAVFGIGMTVGNLMGGRLADGHPSRGLVLGYGGATMMMAIPTIQVRLTRAAPTAPTLMGATNLAALNVANAIGAWSGAHAIASGHGLLSAAWAGFILTSLGLLVFLLTLRRSPQLATA